MLGRFKIHPICDDTNLFHSNTDICELVMTVNNELVKLFEWFRANKLSLNAKKLVL